MTLVRSLYKSYGFVAGVALILLGVGNYLTAGSKVHHYQAVMTTIAALRQPAADFLPYGEKAYFPSEAHERWEIARAKRDFYQVVLSAGRLMMGIGFLCTAVSLVRLRRQRALATTTTLLSTTTGRHYAQHPPSPT
jgi:hypothetical protein